MINRSCSNAVSWCEGPDRYGDICNACLTTWTNETGTGSLDATRAAQEAEAKATSRTSAKPKSGMGAPKDMTREDATNG